MCVVSMIHDHFEPRITPWIKRVMPPIIVPSVPRKTLNNEEIEVLRKLLDDFNAARDAAERVDALTDQPDCVDPEKAKLRERVRELEEELSKIKRSRSSAAVPRSTAPGDRK